MSKFLDLLFSCILVVNSVSTSEDHQFRCYSCVKATNDEECNSKIETCAPDSLKRCLTVTTDEKYIDKKCAIDHDCLGHVSSNVEEKCCSTDLCNNVTIFKSETSYNVLTMSVGMDPDVFLSSIAVYQSIIAVLYALVVIYIIYKTPKRSKAKSKETSNNAYVETVATESEE